MSLDTAALRAAIDRVAAAMERDFDALNAADGAVGDGDLGVTMTRGMRLVREQAPDLPDDLGLALLACARAFTRTSGSSYGTLLATALMAAAKEVKGETDLSPGRVPGLLATARDAVATRGKAAIGGKTMLDSLDALARATDGESEPATLADAAARAVDEALEALRDKPATVGRARIFADKTIGTDDPGMQAMAAIVKAALDRESRAAP